MNTKDILIVAGLGLVIFVVGRKLLEPGPTAPGAGATSPTLGGVANIIGATGGLIDSIKGLVRGEPKAPEKNDEANRGVPQIGRMAIDRLDEQLNFRGEAAIPTSGFAVTA